MKVTALLPDELVKDVQEYSGGKNITDSLVKALSDWLYMKRIEKLNQNVQKEPLQFKENFDSTNLRNSR